MKIICFFRRKPGMSPESFRDYYENRHVPLIQRLLPLMKDYSRNYIRHDLVFTPGHVAAPADTPQFDVITEVTYTSREEYDLMLHATEDPATGRLIQEDEERFMDRSAMVMLIVDEEVTSAEKIADARAAYTART